MKMSLKTYIFNEGMIDELWYVPYSTNIKVSCLTALLERCITSGKL